VNRRLVLPLIPCANEYALASFFIVNDVLARPYAAKSSYTCFCIVEGLHCLDEMQVSIALQLEDAKRQTQPPIGDELLGRTVGRKSAK